MVQFKCLIMLNFYFSLHNINADASVLKDFSFFFNLDFICLEKKLPITDTNRYGKYGK